MKGRKLVDKVLIIGCPGAGKSTLSKNLADELQLPLIHLDQINWVDDHATISKNEFDIALDKVLKEPFWIIDGNYNRTLEKRIQYADTVIWLDFPRWICLYRVLKRAVSGKLTNTHKYGNPNTIEKGFLTFIWNFNSNNRPIIQQILHKYPDKHLDILRKPSQVSRYKKKIKIG